MKARFGGYWYKVWGGPFQPAGIPDLCGIVDGRAVFLEVKRVGESPSRIQRTTMRRLSDEGAIVAVVHSVQEAHDVVRAGLSSRTLCVTCSHLVVPVVAYTPESTWLYCPTCGARIKLLT